MTDTTIIALQSAIQQHHESFRYPIRHVKIKSELLNSGSSNFPFDNVFLGHVQNCLTLCKVENRSMYGVFKENSFHFKHNGSESLIITIGNETLIHLDFDFVNGQDVEAYNTLMKSTGQYKGLRLMLVDFYDFGNGNMILVFDLTGRGECNSEQFTVRKLESVRINLKYSNALTTKKCTL